MLNTSKLKERKEILKTLKAEKGISSEKARVVLVIDKSGSMSGLYKDGTVQETIERVLPVGLTFDDDGEVDVYIFDDGFNRVPTPVKLDNLDGYVKDHLLQYGWGTTNYAPVLNDIIKNYGNPVTTTSGGFLGMSSKTIVDPVKIPTFVIFITDGNNDDKTAAKDAIINASHHAIFVKFIGIGREEFSFLQKLDDLPGRKIDNVNFKKFTDLTATDDRTLYVNFLEEYDGWLGLARRENILL